jgi:hypothetical protein
VFGFVRIERFEILANPHLEPLRFAARDLLRERFLRNPRGVDSQALGLGVKIGIDGEADGLLGGFDAKDALSRTPSGAPARIAGYPTYLALAGIKNPVKRFVRP